MPNYTLLRRGDQLPAVGVLQKLLNRGGAALRPDGDFGQKTEAAVRDFQRQRLLVPDGVIGKDTWPRVSANAELPIVDCIDIFDPDLMNLEMRDIQNAGGNPIEIGGASNGVEQMVQLIASAGRRNLFLLRFHGHGAPGVAGFSFGRGGAGFGHRADIDPTNIGVLTPILTRLRPVFGPYGCVQFMHCSTGRGPSGRAVLTAIAEALRVPVSAGIFDQLGGGVHTFEFEGPTFTAVPGGRSLAQWAQALPDFVGMSVS